MCISEQHVTANDVSLWTATQGVGPPVVLCHGGPGVYDYMEPVAAMIHDLAAVHRYDQRGCGRSQDKDPYDVASFIADLDALRAHWGYESWTVIGHSWGAYLALLYAVKHPERVSRLVHFSGTGINPAWHRDYRRNREAKLSPTSRERLRVLDSRRPAATGEDLACIERERSALIEATNYYDAARFGDTPRFDRFPINYKQNAILNAECNRMEATGVLHDHVRRVDAPTLILDGEGDPRPRWARAQLAGLIPNSRHVTIARAGHETWIERPDATASALREFLVETDRA